MEILDQLIASGAFINNVYSDPKKTEVWFRRDSEALREFVNRLIETYPELKMKCDCRPHQVEHKTMASLWKADTYPAQEPYILISLDLKDVPNYGERWKLSLESLLNEIRQSGPKYCMSFRITVDNPTWQSLVTQKSSASSAPLW